MAPIVIDISRDPAGVLWADDGTERMAVAVEARAQRFFSRGIAARRSRLLARYLRGLVPINPGAVVVNFGANIGEIAVALSNLGALVLAIEPDPAVIPALTANARNRAIAVEAAAAWHKDGLIDVFLNTASADTSVINPSPQKVALPCRRIDGLVRSMGIDRVNLIIGDAEGAEPEVLQGASGILGMTDYISICASKERRGQATLAACEEILKAAGFAIIYRAANGLPLIGKRAHALG